MADPAAPDSRRYAAPGYVSAGGPLAGSSCLTLGQVPVDQALARLRALEPAARAFWIYDLDAFAARAARFRKAFAPLDPLVAYALKANALPALLERGREAGLGADAVSVGELEFARAAGFAPSSCLLNGNGRTPEEAAWAVKHGVHSVNADSVLELDLLEAAAAKAAAKLTVAMRVNPGIEAGTHRHTETGDQTATFGVSPETALEAWAARARWPHLTLEGVHVHIGSQVMDVEPLERAADIALGLVDESSARGAPLSWVNLGGGYAIDYRGDGQEFPLERWAASLLARAAGRDLRWVLEPGRWLVAPVGMLVAEVLATKFRDGRRFVVLAAGMNDFLRPALYQARHRIVAVREREGAHHEMEVVGPVCESSDVFASHLRMPPLEPGDLVAILDAGAYGASMSSNYNGRGRLPELVVSGGFLRRARAGETPADQLQRARWDSL